jgi:aspartyl aminopeptidase
VGVETYGGGLWHSWFDRDLCVAGKIVTNEGTTANPCLKEHLVNVTRYKERLLCVSLNPRT